MKASRSGKKTHSCILLVLLVETAEQKLSGLFFLCWKELVKIISAAKFFQTLELFPLGLIAVFGHYVWLNSFKGIGYGKIE